MLHKLLQSQTLPALFDLGSFQMVVTKVHRGQVEVHPYFRNDAHISWCQDNSIHVTAYAPLGSPDSASLLARTAPVLMQVGRPACAPMHANVLLCLQSD